MGLGGCIILLVVGGILTFATDWHMNGVNLDMVGIIMMLVGIIGIAVYTSVLRRRRPTVPTATTVVEDDHHHLG